MKMLLVALALLVSANGASLGIGIDVLPEAYSFAARRIGFAANLRLASCTSSQCLWDLGGGVRLAAERTTESLDIVRIEAIFDQRVASAGPSASPYEKACLAIIALVAHDAPLADMRVAAKAIAVPSREVAASILLETSDRTISLYGLSPANSGETRRCGATVA